MSDTEKIDEALLATDSEDDTEFLSDSDSEEGMEEEGADGEGEGGEDADADEDDEADDGEDEAGGSVRRAYVPNGEEGMDGEELEYDESAYRLYHKAECGYPCLSFDIIKDQLGSGDDRANDYPLTVYLVAGTQAPKVHVNNLLVMRMSKLNRIKSKERKEGEDSDAEDKEEEEDEENEPQLECAQMAHEGSVNRVRTASLGNKTVAASWSELGKVFLWDLSKQLQAVDDADAMTMYSKTRETVKPVFSFSGHGAEGYAIDWSAATPGLLASGDCNKNIHVWRPKEAFTWIVDQQPLTGHTASVEDIQWSPNEGNVLASCSVDKSIRIWDIRAKPASSCMIIIPEAHSSDVNVISWNRKEPAFLLSGGDDGTIKTWDLRSFAKSKSPQPIATFKHHVAPITSVEWHPTDSTVFGASGDDNQITLWDLSLEKDEEEKEAGQGDEDQDVSDLPPQLLFIHQGQNEIKEIHWHPQMPGLVMSTALSGFDVFRTISV